MRKRIASQTPTPIATVRSTSTVGSSVQTHATPDEPGRRLLLQTAGAMRLSARGYTRILRGARTIADLAGAGTVGPIYVAEALSYRRKAPRAQEGRQAKSGAHSPARRGG